MSVNRPHILADVAEERERQEELWGNEFDDKNNINDWCTYICRYASTAAFVPPNPEQGATQRELLVKTAALALAALEAFDRNNGKFPSRHYDTN